ncbi:MAG: hypothetical protein HND53_06125 [Proteobacteria bacterium]|nr:hypothetical protein [Pseudomonadota bacterium]NOG60060.1 hypothetical protein [Pseudomonadota bacterium]
MDRIVGMVLPTTMLFVGFFFLFCIIFFWQKRINKRKNPLTLELLRVPGESLLNQIDELSIDLFGMLVITFVTPLLFVSIHLSESYIGGMPETIGRLVINLLAMFILTIYCGNKSLSILKDRENKRLGYDAERATG